jgi:hypothetical protein
MLEPSKAVITATGAQLFVSNIRASCDFHLERLGFSIVFVHGQPPFYAQVKRDRGLFGRPSKQKQITVQSQIHGYSRD